MANPNYFVFIEGENRSFRALRIYGRGLSRVVFQYQYHNQRIDQIRKKVLQPILEKSDKHRSKMRKSALSNMIIKGDSRSLVKT